jgi:hypothetical protein
MTRIRLAAAIDVLLVLPAALFMTALFVRSAFPPAGAAQAVIAWYSGRGWTLWLLLLALPAAAVVVGSGTLLATGALRALRQHLAAMLVTATSIAAAIIVAIVMLHMAAN